jgi:tyrosyl-tRNA synthetase
MNLVEIIKLASRKTVAQVLAREDFAKEHAEGVDIRLHEFIYPLLQGWDSVQIHADVEMGGSDQLFNNLVGREFQKEEGQEPQVVMVTPLLVGTDGADQDVQEQGELHRRDRCSRGTDMFGKMMSVPDRLLEMYYTLLTDIPKEDYAGQIVSDPRNAKVRLARTLVSWLHGEEAGAAAQERFEKVIVGKEIPDEMPVVEIERGPHQLGPLLVKAGLAASNGEAIRKMREGAVRLDGVKVTDPRQEHTFEKPVVLQLGNRKFARLVVGGR